VHVQHHPNSFPYGFCSVRIICTPRIILRKLGKIFQHGVFVFYFFPSRVSCHVVVYTAHRNTRLLLHILIVCREQQVGFWRKPFYKSFRKSARTRALNLYLGVFYTPSGCKLQCRPRLQLVYS